MPPRKRIRDDRSKRHHHVTGDIRIRAFIDRESRRRMRTENETNPIECVRLLDHLLDLSRNVAEFFALRGGQRQRIHASAFSRRHASKSAQSRSLSSTD